jgi:hypothetical protein
MFMVIYRRYIAIARAHTAVRPGGAKAKNTRFTYSILNAALILTYLELSKLKSCLTKISQYIYTL